MAEVILKRGEENRIKNGHLWVFSNEIERLNGDATNGDILELMDSRKSSLGFGFYNKNSLISVRLLSHLYTGSISSYINTCLEHGYLLRKRIYPSRESFRMIFSESDFLPGLIIDKYNNTYVLQVYSIGMQKNINDVVEHLKTVHEAENIFTRNENYFRKLEGLPETDEIYYGKMTEEIIDDGKIKYKIDFASSQKTGFYFDQCDNRDFIERFSAGKNTLDAFCNSGGFGLHAAAAGAESVTFVDSSVNEIGNAKYNFSLNGLSSNCDFVVSEVFDYLEECNRIGKKFDMVILDPPAFAKSKKSIPSALKGYIKLNKLALNVISENGVLATASCSHHISGGDFLSAVNTASVKAGRTVQLLHFSGASMDHPCLPAMEETSYLKFALFSVI